jgi:hypothetical protein
MSTRKSNLTLTSYAAKKLLGKAHTANTKDVSNEPYPSNVSVVSEGVFAEAIPNNPGASFYTLYSASISDPGTVEKVYFEVVADTSTGYDADSPPTDTEGGRGDETSDSGYHGYYLRLAGDYETSSSNPNSGSGVFVNNSRIYNSRGTLQLVPPFVSTENPNPYQLKLYNSGGVEISFTDNIDWTVDYYAGTIFIQDYTQIVSGISKVPTSASAYVYVGKYLNDKLSDLSSSGGGSNITVKDEGSSLSTAAVSFDFVGSGVTATKPSGENITVTIPGGVNYSRDAVLSTITASVTSSILGVSASTALDIRLPAASGYSAGQYFTIKDEGGNSNTNNITIRTSGSNEIDGESYIILESPYAAVNIYSDGTSKFFIY